jgi:hypothetical protein
MRKDAPALRARVVVAMLAVLASKAITLIMPFAYKGVIDRMAPGMQAGALIAIALVCGLCRARVSAACCSTICATWCSKRVGQEATRRLAEMCSYTCIASRCASTSIAHRRGHQSHRARHQEHRHDALLPAVQHRADHHRADRGLRHLLREIRAGLVAATLAMVVVYIWFTRTVTEWRNQLRRDMVDLDTDAMSPMRSTAC